MLRHQLGSGMGYCLLATVVASAFVFQIDEVESKILSANSISDFSHSLGHKQTCTSGQDGGPGTSHFIPIKALATARGPHTATPPKTPRVPPAGPPVIVQCFVAT
jgi:hypothetical protein